MPIPLSPAVLRIDADYTSRARVSAGGIRISNAALRSAMSDLNQVIGQGVRYRPVDYSGVRDAAQGVVQLTGAARDLMERNQDITDKRLMYDAETHLLAGQLDLEGILSNEKDPTKWEQTASSHMGQVLSGIKTEGMSDAAREHLMQFADRTRLFAITKARNSGIVENERQMVQSGLALHRIGVETNNPALAASAIVPLVQSGAITPEVGQEYAVGGAMQIQKQRRDALRDQVDNAVRAGDFAAAQVLVDASEDLRPDERKAFEVELSKKREGKQMEDAIAKDPAGMLKLLSYDGEFPQWSPAEIQDWQDKAFAAVQSKSMQSYVAAEDAVARGILTKPEQLDSPEWRGMTPARREALRETLQKGQPNNEQEWMSMAASITNFTPTGDENKDRLAYADMEALVKTRFRGPYQDQLLELLQRTQDTPPSDAYSSAYSRVTQAFKDGYLGNYRVPYEEGYTPGAVGSFFGRDAKPGTALSPEDRARTSSQVPKTQRLEAGELVTDQRKLAEANTALRNIMKQMDDMKRRGMAPEKVEQFVEDQIRLHNLLPVIPDSSTQYRTPSFGPNPLLPDVNAPAPTLQDMQKFIEGLK